VILKTAKLLIGQDKLDISKSFGQFFTSSGYQVHVARTGDKVMEFLRNGASLDLLVMDDSVKLPDAVEICRAFKAAPEHRMIPILVLASGAIGLDPNAAIEAGCDDYLAHPVMPNVFAARVRSLLRLRRLTEELDDVESVLYTLARTIEAKDPYTMGHAERVGQFAMVLGKRLGVDESDRELLRKGGMLHDVGKIAVPDAILTKPGKYTPEEFDAMKRHPVLGCEICEKLRTVRDALPLIRHHHERLDGSGYPDGLSGDQITPLIRIVSIVDVYDALRSKRSYKEAFSIDKSLEILWQETEKGWWDKNILSVWEKAVRANNADPYPAK